MKLVQGVGINDADYVVKPVLAGVRVYCPYYLTWQRMLRRCYSKKLHRKHPTYIGCSVCEEWLIFSKFKAWMETQDWEGNQLDKDILSQGNKVYSPDTCVFISQNVNKLLTDSSATRGMFMLGVYWNKNASKFKACCGDNNGRQVYLGYYNTELSAHLAWKSYKHKIACELADAQMDERVANALRVRYI